METKPRPIKTPGGASSAEQSRYRPFNVHWLDSALHETLLPGSPWQQVNDRISERLAQSLESELEGSKEERQMIYQLLGPIFVKKYMKNVLYRPDLLDASVLSADHRKSLQHSSQVLLKEQLDKALRDLGYARPSSSSSNRPDYSQPTDQQGDQQGDQLADHQANQATDHQATDDQQADNDQQADDQQADNDQPNDLQAAIDYTRAIMATGMERECVLQEMNLKKAPPSVDKDLEEPDSDPLKLSGQVSDLLGKSVVAILRRDPSRLANVCLRLGGRQLPSPLRSYVWRGMLLQAVDNSGDGKDKISEKFIRKRFAKAVSKGKVDMKISQATECPIGGLIERAVKEKYDSTPCMQAHRQGKLQTHTREALNVMYTYNRSYEPFLINWLFPLQLAFQEDSHKEEHPYELALYLDFLRTHAFPKWPEVFATAERVMTRLCRSDWELHDHLQRCAVTNVKVDPQEFLVQLIDAEKKKAAALAGTTGSSAGEKQDKAADKDLLANPLIFLRKWIGEGFVCVLSKPAVMYLWDQCFMEQWDRIVLERACLALLFLLREKFLWANDYHQMRQVFLKEPSKILTLDIVKAYQQMRESMKDSEEALSSTPMPVAASPMYSGDGDKVKLQLASLKDVRVKLIWNVADSHLSGVQPDRVVISLFLLFGGKVLQVSQVRDSVTLTSLTKSKRPIFDSSPADGKQITFPAKELNVREKDRNQEPRLILRVRYKTTDEEEDADNQLENRDSLAWALIPVYKSMELPSGSSGTAGQPVVMWAPSNSSGTAPLYFGAIPSNVTSPGEIKRFSSRDLLQEGSEVSFNVFGPRDPAEDAPTAEEGYELYIDGIRFLPDNATICKITGRIVNPVDKERPDILMTAPLESPARCPRIQSRYKITSAATTNLAVLRVYTVDKATKSVCIIGSTVLQIYDLYGTKKLRAGGHELRLHHGMVPVDQISPEAMAALRIIPACTLLVRLLPISKKYVQIPDYDEGSYSRETFQPSASELRLMEYYKRSPTWKDTIKGKLLELRQDEDGPSTASDEELMEWQLDRLDYKKQTPKARGPASHLSTCRYVDYSSVEGLEVAVVSAKAISSKGMYTSVVVYVLPGSDMDPSLQGSNRDQFLVMEAELSSPQNAPVFRDPPKKMNAVYSNKSILLFRLIGLSVTYKPDPDGQGSGTVHGRDGNRPVSLDPDSYLGWTAMPFFFKGCATQGNHHLPIFKDTGKMPFLSELTDTDDLRVWLRKALKDETIALDPELASLEVALWDGHFDREDAPLSRETRFLKVGDKKKFLQVAEEADGPPLSELVLKDLPPGSSEDKVLEDFGTAIKTAVENVIEKMGPLN